MKEKSVKGKIFDKLWAPWRMKYIEEIDADDSDGCIFCDKPQEKEDKENLILHRGKKCFVILNKFPYNNGHILIVPYHHTSEISDLDQDTMLELMETVNLVVEAIKSIMRPDGFNVGMNLGRSAGAGIAEHVHMHVVPRWIGDTNFMPVIGGTKVI
ncbi:HIT domain-containing protein, partial [Candidatus Latescibacterota bacterium]